MAPELPPGHGDGRRLTQVLINLVGNAIKFTDAGEVAIKAEEPRKRNRLIGLARGGSDLLRRSNIKVGQI